MPRGRSLQGVSFTVDELYDADAFEGELPLWFVVAEGFTEPDSAGRRRLTRLEPAAFCGGNVGGARCVLLFTDEDLAQRHAAQITTGPAVPVGMFSLAELSSVLTSFYPNDFDSVIVDPGSAEWQVTRTRKPVPEFIASFRTQKRNG